MKTFFKKDEPLPLRSAVLGLVALVFTYKLCDYLLFSYYGFASQSLWITSLSFVLAFIMCGLVSAYFAPTQEHQSALLCAMTLATLVIFKSVLALFMKPSPTMTAFSSRYITSQALELVSILANTVKAFFIVLICIGIGTKLVVVMREKGQKKSL